MEWLNIKTSALHAPEFIGSDPVERATWLALCLWSAQQENGGRIEGAAEWKDRQWQQTCGVTAREVRAASKLLTWEGDTLVIWNYPRDKEQVVQRKRETARKNGLEGGRPHKATPDSTSEPTQEPTLVITSVPNSEPVSESGKERKGREGNGIGKEEGAGAPGADDEQAVGIPDSLNTPLFCAAWVRWENYRRERKLPRYKATSLAIQFKTLAEWGPDAAIESITDSIRNQWQGLFQPKPKPGQPLRPAFTKKPRMIPANERHDLN